jgi:hypothetical protein
MQSKKIWVHRQQTKNDAEDDFYWQRTCIPCVAKEDGITEEDAKLQVLAGPMEHKSKRAHQYKLACESKREEFEAMPGDGPSRKERRKLTLASMKELFQPLAEFIIRKHSAMTLVVKDVKRHEELVRELAKCKSITQEQAILDEMENLEVDDKFLAFESKGPEQQHDFILASSYSDEWTEIKNGKGQVVGGICSWYVCRARTAWDDAKGHVACNAVTPSKDWDRKFEDLLASKRRWCSHCAARYNASWGQLVELKRVNANGELERFYMKADVPTWDAEDVRAMYHEATMDPSSPMELYNNVKRVVPTVSNLIVASGSHHKICNNETWDSLPLFKWSEIFSMANIQPPKGCK